MTVSDLKDRVSREFISWAIALISVGFGIGMGVAKFEQYPGDVRALTIRVTALEDTTAAFRRWMDAAEVQHQGSAAALRQVEELTAAVRNNTRTLEDVECYLQSVIDGTPADRCLFNNRRP